MKKTSFKTDRMAEQMKYAIQSIIDNEIDSLDFVSITDVELTKDLGDAKIYFNCLESNKTIRIQQKLEQSRGFIRKRVAQEVKMRRTPNLIFKYDDSLDNYNKIEDLLK